MLFPICSGGGGGNGCLPLLVAVLLDEPHYETSNHGIPKHRNSEAVSLGGAGGTRPSCSPGGQRCLFLLRCLILLSTFLGERAPGPRSALKSGATTVESCAWRFPRRPWTQGGVAVLPDVALRAPFLSNPWRQGCFATSPRFHTSSRRSGSRDEPCCCCWRAQELPSWPSAASRTSRPVAGQSFDRVSDHGQSALHWVSGWGHPSSQPKEQRHVVRVTCLTKCLFTGACGVNTGPSLLPDREHGTSQSSWSRIHSENPLLLLGPNA